MSAPRPSEDSEPPELKEMETERDLHLIRVITETGRSLKVDGSSAGEGIKEKVNAGLQYHFCRLDMKLLPGDI